MEKLKVPALRTSASPGSQPTPAMARRAVMTLDSAHLPMISNRLTDVEIPRAVWSPWLGTGKPRELVRQLTAGERSALEGRRDELAPALAPFGTGIEADRVHLSLADVFGSFRSMRHTGAEAVAIVDASCRALAEFPCWAIEKACRSIQVNGVWRDGKFDRQWPPNDAELVDAVRKEVRLYGDQHRSAASLLEAKVEER
jgi:hypothetical protein